MTIHEIIAHFGTMTKMSNKTGIPHRTIQDWKRGEGTWPPPPVSWASHEIKCTVFSEQRLGDFGVCWFASITLAGIDGRLYFG